MDDVSVGSSDFSNSILGDFSSDGTMWFSSQVTFFVPCAELIVGLLLGQIKILLSQLCASIFKVLFRTKKRRKPPDEVTPSTLRFSFLVLIGTFGTISFQFGSAQSHNFNFEFGNSLSFLADFRLSFSRNQDSEGDIPVDCRINGFGQNHSCASHPLGCSRPLHLLGGSEAVDSTGIFAALHSKNTQAQRDFHSAAFGYPSYPFGIFIALHLKNAQAQRDFRCAAFECQSHPPDVGTLPFADAPHP